MEYDIHVRSAIYRNLQKQEYNGKQASGHGTSIQIAS